jgi:hypothetical protein
LGDISFLNTVIYGYRLHSGNTSRNRQLMYDSQLQVRRKLYHLADLDKNEKHLILLGHRYHELHRARINLFESARKLSRGKWIEAFKQLGVAMGHILSSFEPVRSILS